MKKRIISIAAVFSFLICMVVAPEINVAASEEPKMVDGSYLTTYESSTGTTSNKETR